MFTFTSGLSHGVFLLNLYFGLIFFTSILEYLGWFKVFKAKIMKYSFENLVFLQNLIRLFCVIFRILCFSTLKLFPFFRLSQFQNIIQNIIQNITKVIVFYVIFQHKAVYKHNVEGKIKREICLWFAFIIIPSSENFVGPPFSASTTTSLLCCLYYKD